MKLQQCFIEVSLMKLQSKFNEISIRFRITILKQVKRTLDRYFFLGVKKCQYPSPQLTSSIGTSSQIIWSFLNSNFFLFHFCAVKMGVGIHRSIYYELYDSQPHFFFSSATAFVARRWYVPPMNGHQSSISRDRNPFFGVLKLCETLLLKLQ